MTADDVSWHVLLLTITGKYVDFWSTGGGCYCIILISVWISPRCLAI